MTGLLVVLLLGALALALLGCGMVLHPKPLTEQEAVNTAVWLWAPVIVLLVIAQIIQLVSKG